MRQLREGWYGSVPQDGANDGGIKPANCLGLYKKALGMANKRFIPLCPRLSGTVGTLEVTAVPRTGTAAYPIDLIVADLASEDVMADDNDVEDNRLEWI